MGLLNKVKSLAFTPEQMEEVQSIPARPNPSPGFAGGFAGGGAYRRIVPQATALSGNSHPPSPADPEMSRDIGALLGQCRSKGYDELLNLMNVLAASIPDEGARINAALASVTAMLQITPSQVKQAIQERLDAVNRYEASVNTELQKELQDTKAQNEAHLADVNRRVAELQQELARLTQDGTDTHRTLSEMDAKAADVQSRLAATVSGHRDNLTGLLSRIR